VQRGDTRSQLLAWVISSPALVRGVTESACRDERTLDDCYQEKKRHAAILTIAEVFIVRLIGEVRRAMQPRRDAIAIIVGRMLLTALGEPVRRLRLKRAGATIADQPEWRRVLLVSQSFRGCGRWHGRTCRQIS